MNFIGMDIHKRFTVAVAKDKEGNKLAEERKADEEEMKKKKRELEKKVKALLE